MIAGRASRIRISSGCSSRSTAWTNRATWSAGGTGLGLSIARNIARWHGGDVTLRNAASGLVAELALPR
jgi:signal transduction histidine kinase